MNRNANYPTEGTENTAPEETEEVIEEVVEEEVVEDLPEQEVQASQQSVELPAQQSVELSVQSKNMREMRLIKERAEKERDEAYRLLQQIKESVVPKKQPEPEDTFDIGENDLVEGKHLRKFVKEFKELKSQVENHQKASISATVETRLKQRFNDFDQVVTKENVEALVAQYPEIGNTLRSNPDLYSQAVTAHTMIKNLGIYKEDIYAADRAKANHNSNKPRPLASVSPRQGDTPLSNINSFSGGLTEELKQRLRKEMDEARKRY